MAQYTIRELAQQFDLTASTLRYYEQIGILTGVGRTASGQRVYTQAHVNRLKTIRCFKNTGMTMTQLQTFFSYEEQEADHIDDILALLDAQRQSILERAAQMQRDYEQVRRKLRYYAAIKQALDAGTPLPDWDSYRTEVCPPQEQLAALLAQR